MEIVLWLFVSLMCLFVYATTGSAVGHRVFRLVRDPMGRHNVCPNHHYSMICQKEKCAKDCDSCGGEGYVVYHPNNQHDEHYDDLSSPRALSIVVGILWPIAGTLVVAYLCGAGILKVGILGPVRLGRHLAGGEKPSSDELQRRIEAQEKELGIGNV